MANLAARHPVVLHIAIATAIATSVIAATAFITARHPESANMLPDLWKWIDAQKTYINIVSIARFAATRSTPEVYLIFVFASAPSIAAIIVSFWAYGYPGFAKLMSRLKPWGQPSDRSRALLAYALIVLGYFVGIAICFTSLKLYGKAGSFDVALTRVGGSILTLIPIALIGFFIDEGGSLEELGWRGFVLPLMLKYFKSPLVAALVLGVIWWAWHFPREIPGLISGQSLTPAFLLGQSVFLALVLALSIIATCFVNMTGGSVLPAIMLHGGTNFWSKALQPVGSAEIFGYLDLRTALVFVIAAVVLAIAGPNLAYRPQGA